MGSEMCIRDSIWAKWGSYHAAAEDSSGFRKTKEGPPKDLSQQPQVVQDCITYVVQLTQRGDADVRVPA